MRFDDGVKLASERAPERFGDLNVFWRGSISGPHAQAAQVSPETEILGRAYRRFGEEFPQHIKGAFAAVVIDAARATAVLAHDELALESLFYTPYRGGLIVATHLLDIVRATGVGELDETYISDYLAHGWHFGGHTPYVHIRRLQAGEAVVLRGGDLKRVSAWTLDRVAPLRFVDARDYEAQFREIVQKAVARAMPPGNVCCELSGGLDSTTVLAVAMGLAPQRISACSFVYPRSASADERPWMEAALEKYPAPWQAFDGDALRPFSVLPDMPQGEPNQSLINAGRQNAYYAYLRARDIRTVLTGEGGDATFCGDSPAPFYLADLLRGLRFRELGSAAAAHSRESDSRRPSTYFLWRYAAIPVVAHALGRPVESSPTPSPWLNAEFARRTDIAHRSKRTWAPRTKSIDASAVLEQVIRCARLAAGFYSGDDIPAQFRHPLLDRDLVAFMFSVPWPEKTHPTCDRLLQRRALENVLPRKVLLRKNKISPEEALYAGLAEGGAWLDWLADRPRIIERGYVDATAWRSALAQARLANTVGVRYFQAAACLEAWLRLLETRDVRIPRPAVT